MNLLEEFKNIDPNSRELAVLVKLAAFAAMFLLVIVIGAFFDWQGQYDSLKIVKQEEEKLRETFLAKKREAINLDIIKKQLIDTQQSFGPCSSNCRASPRWMHY